MSPFIDSSVYRKRGHAREHYVTPNISEEPDVLIANTSVKANEATLAFSNWSRRMKKNGVMVIIVQAPEGRTTHYLYGKFGKKQMAPGCTSEKTAIGFNKLIVFSGYKTPDPFLPIADPEKNYPDKRIG